VSWVSTSTPYVQSLVLKGAALSTVDKSFPLAFLCCCNDDIYRSNIVRFNSLDESDKIGSVPTLFTVLYCFVILGLNFVT
jgi:hypothetical protein